MDTLKAFSKKIAVGHDAKNRVFDWDKAARLIKKHKPKIAGAGLQSDWEWTGGDIYRNGKVVPREDTYTYLSSCWCIPELSLDGELQECWKFQDKTPGWDEHTYWPPSARKILKPR